MLEVRWYEPQLPCMQSSEVSKNEIQVRGETRKLFPLATTRRARVNASRNEKRNCIANNIRLLVTILYIVCQT